MEDATLSRQMSLVPYAGNGEVVLRRGNAVVIYDAQSRQLSVRNAGPENQALEVTECPYCHRPLRDDYDSRQDSRERQRTEFADYEQQPRQHSRQYVDPHYFAMLAQSQRPTPNVSAPATPPEKLPIPALRSGRSREPSGSGVQRVVDPPTGAEFVGSDPSATSSKGISNSAFTPGYFKQFFRELGVLGRGGNGVVLLVEHVMDDISLGNFACKRVPVGNDHSWLEKVLLEVKLLQGILHKNLVTYHWVWLEDHQSSKFGPSIPCLWILQEYCNGGDLHNYVCGPMGDGSSTKEKLKERFRRNSKGDAAPPVDKPRHFSKLTFDEIFSFFRDITSGLHHLHSKGYIHRDLKPSNCLLNHDGNRTRILISDFGEVQAAGTNRGNTGATGTISYCAPEVLRKDAQAGTFGNFTTKSDIFSLGMIVFFMCFGRLPYMSADGVDEEKEDLDGLRDEILRWGGFGEDRNMRALRSDLPEQLYRFLKRLLSVDPNERPSTDDILASIKSGGADVGEGYANPVLETQGENRVSPLDDTSAPLQPEPNQSRSQSPSFDSDFKASPVTARQDEKARSLSPTKTRPPQLARMMSITNGPVSPTGSSNALTARPRKIELPPLDQASMSSPQQSPRLMLPPPPQGNRVIFMWLRHVVRHQRENTTRIFQITSFFLKLLSLSLPCSPYAANPWALYPLLALATFEMAGILNPSSIRRSILFLGFHLVVVYSVAQHGRLCEIGRLRPVVWEMGEGGV
ncbi:kinase-like protein [Polychaeton citri CBS 116435]|uniref:non-specific serine/threonine protein kinase n=1 Tax=Polychaeton citri CBS 116435 TaxID=1314669 RepID=A0A9P4QIH6_9PEZI|nr:kinase-like protein [Polychaeton citri CBS 116435]